jgi:hypothetical protein
MKQFLARILVGLTLFHVSGRLLCRGPARGCQQVGGDPPAVQVAVTAPLQQGQGAGPVRPLPPHQVSTGTVGARYLPFSCTVPFGNWFLRRPMNRHLGAVWRLIINYLYFCVTLNLKVYTVH